MNIYDICIHGDDYDEITGVEFSNPVHVGDFVTDGITEMEYEVFQVVHSSVAGGSAVHVRPPKEILKAVNEISQRCPYSESIGDVLVKMCKEQREKYEASYIPLKDD